jgi:hypothetical protein
MSAVPRVRFKISMSLDGFVAGPGAAANGRAEAELSPG